MGYRRFKSKGENGQFCVRTSLVLVTTVAKSESLNDLNFIALSTFADSTSLVAARAHGLTVVCPLGHFLQP